MRREPTVDWCFYGEQRERVEPHLARALHYLPSSTESVSIRYALDETNLASTTVLPRYRTQNIRIGNGWFAENEGEQGIALIHEVLHGHIEVLAEIYANLLKATLPDEADPLHVWAVEQWAKAEEGVICELSHRIHEREKLIP